MWPWTFQMVSLQICASLFVIQCLVINRPSQAQECIYRPSLGVIYTSSTRTCFSLDNLRSAMSPTTVGWSWDIVWRQVDHNNSVLISRTVCDLIETGVQSLITILPPQQRAVVMSQAKAFRLPNINIDIRAFRTPLYKDFTIPLHAYVSIPSRLLRDIVSAVRWTSAAFIFDDILDPGERERFHQFTPGLSPLHVFSATLTTRNNVRIIPEISFLRRPFHNFLYIGRSELWTRLVKERRHLLNEDISWIVMSDVTRQEALSTLQWYVASNVLFVTEKWRKCMEERLQQNGTHGADNVFSRSTIIEDLLLHSFNIFSKVKSIPQCLRNGTRGPCSAFRPAPMQNGSVLFNRLVEEFTSQRGRDVIGSEYEISSVFGQKTVSIVKVGYWSETRGLVTEKRSLFLNTFHDFGTEPILVAATEALPFLARTEVDGRVQYTGFSVDILNELAKHMRFNYTIIEPPDNFYGAPSGNGTWNGMVGMVYRGEAEMAIGPFTITSLREQVIDFTIPFSEGSTGIITLSPGYEANKSLFQTLKPYSVPVWLSVAGAVALVGCTSLLVNRATPFRREPEDRPLQAKYETSLGDNMWMVYSSVSEQGIQHSPEAVSGRCLIGFWWLFTILLVATYTANLAAFLTISLPLPPINTLGELLAQDKIQPIVQAGTSFETMFKNSQTDLYKRTWSRLTHSPKISHESSILELVKAGQYAYISDRPVLDYMAGQECQTYSVAEESFDVVGYGMVIPEGAPYGKLVNKLIMKMQEAGLMDKWRRHWWSSNSSCQGNSQTLHSRLGLDSLGGLFLLYLGSVGLACVWFLLDILCNGRRIQK